MLNIFNEKTVAALQIDGYEETATFVHHVTRLFHMLNVKDLYSGQAYNDPDREPYRSMTNPRFSYIISLAHYFKKMNASLNPSLTRVMSLTKQTSDALFLTLNGMVDLIRTLLSKPHIHYVLSGTMQSDRLEAEFGIYRQLNGGNFYMSSEQINNCLKLQRIKIFDRLGISETSLWSRVLFVRIDRGRVWTTRYLFSDITYLSVYEKSSLYYLRICRQKENFGTEISHSTIEDCPHSEFTELVSRGSLCHPPNSLYDLGLVLFTYYKSLPNKTCTTKVLKAFREIYELSQCLFDNEKSVLNRFLNTFTKGFSIMCSEKILIDKKGDIKKRRMNYN